MALEGAGDALDLAVQPEQTVRRGGQVSAAARALAALMLELDGNVLHDPRVEPSYDGLLALVIYQDVGRTLGHTVTIGASGPELERRWDRGAQFCGVGSRQPSPAAAGSVYL
jgi:hypothetical protein